MKILLLIDSLVSGGRERRLVELIKGLRQFPAIELKLVIFSDKVHYKEIYNFGISVIIITRIPKRNPIVFLKLYRICREWKPDLIHSWGTMSAIFAIPSSLFLNIKLINGNVTDAPINMDFFDKRLFRARLTFPFSAIVVGNSRAGLEAYHVPSNKAYCIHNGFDIKRSSELVDKNEIINKFNIKTSKIVGMVGGFYDRKDYATYFSAALIVMKEREDVSFMAIGEGPNLVREKERIPSKYASRCIFTGSQTDVESIVNIFDIGVLSTNIQMHGEGISNSILEYMALGKPVVATSGGGTNEIVLDQKTGILVPARSPQIMAECLNQLLNDNKRSMEMGQAGKSRVLNLFSLDKMTKSYIELYNKLLGRI